MAADHLFELDADLLALASELEGHPDNVAAALYGGFVICADGQATRFDVPAGLEAVLVVPHEPVRTREARDALPSEVPIADAIFNVGHAALLTLGLPRGEWDLVARGLRDVSRSIRTIVIRSSWRSDKPVSSIDRQDSSSSASDDSHSHRSSLRRP